MGLPDQCDRVELGRLSPFILPTRQLIFQRPSDDIEWLSFLIPSSLDLHVLILSPLISFP